MCELTCLPLREGTASARRGGGDCHGRRGSMRVGLRQRSCCCRWEKTTSSGANLDPAAAAPVRWWKITRTSDTAGGVTIFLFLFFFLLFVGGGGFERPARWLWRWRRR